MTISNLLDVSRFDRDESGTSLTEFAMMLPIFLVIFAGLIDLGRLGVANVNVSTHSYAHMWEDANEKSSEVTGGDIWNDPGSLSQLSPRGDLVEIFDTDLTSGVSVIEDGAMSVATGVGGHWAEAQGYATIGSAVSGGQVDWTGTITSSEATDRLDTVSKAPWNATSEVLGDDQQQRARFAFDDNLVDWGSFDIDGVGGLVGAGLAGLLTSTGAAGPLFAGIRYGDGEGSASITIDEGTFLRGVDTQMGYSMGLSPHAGDDVGSIPMTELDLGGIGREQQQWFFYYGTGQVHNNQMWKLDLLGQDLDGDDGIARPDQYGSTD